MVKQGGGPVLWGCFSAGSGNLDCIRDLDSLKYQSILTKIVMFLVNRLKLMIIGFSNWTIVPKQTFKSTEAWDWSQNVLEWPVWFPDLNAIKIFLEFEEHKGNMKSKIINDLETEGMGQDCNRKVSEACKITFIGGCKEYKILYKILHMGVEQF